MTVPVARQCCRFRKIGGRGKRLRPERGRRVCVKKHGANAVVQGTQCAFCLPF
jgi:hypothetical protein